MRYQSLGTIYENAFVYIYKDFYWQPLTLHSSQMRVNGVISLEGRIILQSSILIVMKIIMFNDPRLRPTFAPRL